jgi:4-azaleucine resistance transporter AzlC
VTKNNQYLQSFKDSSPILAGYFIVSFVFGIGCVKLGLPIWVPVLMSIFVYAGAAQFSFLVLFASSSSIFTIVLTTFLINLRHLLMSIYMANIFDKLQIKKKFRWLYGYELTDESFAFHSANKNKNLNHKYFLSFNFFCHFFWVLGSFAGAVFIANFQTIEIANMEYALTAMMLYILVLLTTDKRKAVVAIVATVVMIILSSIYQSHFNIFIATFIAVGVGIWMKKRG